MKSGIRDALVVADFQSPNVTLTSHNSMRDARSQLARLNAHADRLMTKVSSSFSDIPFHGASDLLTSPGEGAIVEILH